MLKRYRESASYGSLNNNCTPYTTAITDNSKFNLGTMANIYIDVNPDVPKKCKELTNHSNPKDIKAFDKNREICLNEEAGVEPSGCKSCSVENIV
jgi:hypothetical protein